MLQHNMFTYRVSKLIALALRAMTHPIPHHRGRGRVRERGKEGNHTGDRGPGAREGSRGRGPDHAPLCVQGGRRSGSSLRYVVPPELGGSQHRMRLNDSPKRRPFDDLSSCSLFAVSSGMACRNVAPERLFRHVKLRPPANTRMNLSVMK